MAKAQLASNQLPQIVIDLRENYQAEIAGFGLFALGLLAFASMQPDDSLAWIEKAVGWTAPLFAASFLIAGIVLMMRGKIGYWSTEALVGAELLLFSLVAGSFVVLQEPFSFSRPIDGTGGGILGLMLGGFLVELAGHTVATGIIAILAVLGVVLLIRYSPLLYLAAYGARLLPIVPIYWRWLTQEMIQFEDEEDDYEAIYNDALAQTANFVSAHADVLDDEYDGYEGLVGETSPEVTQPPFQPDESLATASGSSLVTQSHPGTKSKKAKSSKSVEKKKAPRKSSKKSTPVRTTAFPPIDLLKPDNGIYDGANAHVLEQTIERTLEDFDVPVRVVHVESGPTVTQFGVEPLYVEKSGQRRKVRVNRIASLADDLALALAAKSVRIEAPVPGRPYVGIEVPNSDKTMVALRGLIESPAMKKKSGELMMGLGRDTSGEPIVMDLAKAPHMLIAGATGAGKSVCINSILTSLLMKHGPESLQLVLVDPKMVELQGYNGIPHLIGKVITDVDQVMGALTWLLIQMDDRYQLFREHGVRNITAYNELAKKHRRGKDAMEPLPYIVLVVDELADLMMTAAEDVERQVTRLAQMARATGIHLILATQRPSTDVVTGVIKANFPTRISFAVTSQVDSRVILDQQGAERLLGQGDMLLLRPDAAKLFRLQGCYVSDAEIDKVVEFWQQSKDGSQTIVPPWNGLMDRLDDEDELIIDAIDLLHGMKTCSTSMLQRKLRLGYPKAARLMGQLEDRGIVGPDMGGGQGREVLVDNADDDDAEGNEADIDVEVEALF